ncbi:aldolase catalytic domain-containing protein [Rossellomorea oryzaecorticis]|uniref:Aldolase catalytic domain-containing protein n=1 Tax=Rossellomorea oryzaecorticis TaxID=1396505 RepID=A0ABU9K3Z3_9BACI
MSDFKILDCTLRDGGYYTDWDFSKELVNKYIEAVAALPIDYVEIGYRSPSKKGYLGEYFYLPINTIRFIRENIRQDQKIAIMINTKDINNEEQFVELLNICKSNVNMVRFATSPENISYSISLASRAKKLGFEVAINLMYLSKLTISDIDYLINLDSINDLDYIYFVDSYGACTPDQVARLITHFNENSHGVKIGFHGHDNLELVFANTLKAVDKGVSMVDATFTGMGRGAGNLKTELITLYKSKTSNTPIDFDAIEQIVNVFNELKDKYGWGTSLPYMFAGLNGLPQDKVMSLLSKNRYSASSIIESFSESNHYNNVYLPQIEEENSDSYENVIIIGGGKELSNHHDAIIEFAKEKNALIINSTTKNQELFNVPDLKRFVCLPGDERNKIKGSFSRDNGNIKGMIVTHNTAKLIKEDDFVSPIYTIEIDSRLDFENDVKEDAPLAMALTLSLKFKSKNVYLAGFDGYLGLTEKERSLSSENQKIINCYNDIEQNNIQTLTPSLYNIDRYSVYSYIANKKNIGVK